MGFYFPPLNGNHNDKRMGTLTFGGVDDQHIKGPIRYYKSIYPEYWSVNITKIKFGDEIIDDCIGGCIAVVDTGNSFLGNPEQYYKISSEKIKKQLERYRGVMNTQT